MSPRDVYLKQHTSDSSFIVKTDIIISGVAITRDHMAVWSDQQVMVYSVSFDKHMAKQTGIAFISTDLVFKKNTRMYMYVFLKNLKYMYVHVFVFTSCIFLSATFSSSSCYAAIHELSVYTVENDKLIARNTQVCVTHTCITYMYIQCSNVLYLYTHVNYCV